MANKELHAFNYISSHDLQEPLRKIQTFANSILTTEYANLSEQGKDHLNRMHNAARRMQALIKDLLEYAHTDIQDRIFEPTDLNEIIKEVCDELSDDITEKNAVISVGDLCKVHVNKFQFRQVMNNLISNALKFSKPGVPCEIVIKNKTGPGLQFENENSGLLPGKLSPAKNYCHLNLTDNGIGYDSKYRDQIFEVFQRLHAKEEYAGTGIGLAIVKKIIDNHRGAITSNSALGKGASFDIYIPDKQVTA
jgi:light-regulated signal transduction histidine kinase (bacteriophytochrome)